MYKQVLKKKRFFLRFLHMHYLTEFYFSPCVCIDRKSTRLNSSHVSISYAVFCLKKKKNVIYFYLLSFLLRLISFSLFILRPPISTLFPYTTLFRSFTS